MPFEAMRSFYREGKTRELQYRKEALLRMQHFLSKEEPSALEAIGRDLGKSAQESYLTELALLHKELRMHIRKLKAWSSPRRVRTPLFLWPSRSRVITEPYGQVLLMSPWNYPLQLALLPLVGAIAAGNVVVLKCSPLAPETAAWVQGLIRTCFDEKHVACLVSETPEEDYALNQTLLAQTWDFIFYTGSTAMGKVVMKSAAEQLTPLCLELGGKSPCIVDQTAQLRIAARRIAWGKCLNAGQTCVAPDHVYVHHAVKEALIHALKEEMKSLYGSDFQNIPYYSRMITEKATVRMQQLTQDQKILFGGRVDVPDRFVEPCLVDEPDMNTPLMQEEIFGPILPVLAYDSLEQLCEMLAERPKPLALYVFADRSSARYVLNHTTSGGACVNDVILHLSNLNLPFGGVGHSGVGAYHGKYSYDSFSHSRAVLVSSARWDIKIKYPPYRAFSWIKKIMK